MFYLKYNMKLLISYFLCFYIGFFSVNAETRTEVSVSHASIDAGGYVEVTCKIYEYQDGTLVSWYKRQGKDQQVLMGGNTELSKTFTGTGRYSAKEDNTDDATMYIVMITGAVAEDSGEIGCEIQSADVALKYATVEVRKPVSEVHLHGLDEGGQDAKEYKDGDTIEFHDGEKFYFRCEASGSNPAPTFDITFNDKSVIEKFDYKSSYTVEGGQPGLKQVKYTAMATTKSPIVITNDQNTLPFKCSAKVPNTEAKNVTIKPTMSFTPLIRCPKEEILLPIFSINLEVECTVKSDPHAEDIYLFWKNIHGANNTLRSDDVYGHYRMHVSSGATQDEEKVIFEVDRLGPQSFRTYTIYARNSMGTSSKTITLKRDLSKETNTGSTLSKFSILVTVLLSYLVVYL